jgi:hypothetical protein
MLAFLCVGTPICLVGWLLGAQFPDLGPVNDPREYFVRPAMLGIWYFGHIIYSLPQRLLKPLLRGTGNQVLEIKKRQ